MVQNGIVSPFYRFDHERVLFGMIVLGVVTALGGGRFVILSSIGSHSRCCR